jgi:putative long chain acyl-CoA synthase
VAVLMPTDGDLIPAAHLGGISDIIVDPGSLKLAGEAARELDCQVLVLGGGEARDLDLPTDIDVVDMEQIDPDAVELPGWYRPNPGFARDLAFVAFGNAAGELVAKQITNFRWALSAFGTASTAALGPNDTVYCLTPLHHESGLLVSLGGAVVGGARIALSRGLNPDRFVSEVRQYGVSVVSYTWAMLREVIDDPNFVLQGNHPVRLFIGSGMPTGLWNRVTEVFAPAHVVEFFATKDGQAVLANVSGAKVGSKGRPLPGAVDVQLAAYDSELDLILEDDRGFVRVAETDEVGVMLAKPRGPIDPSASVKRGVFAPADTWISTEFLFRRDADGDYWLVGGRASSIRTDRGIAFPVVITDALGAVTGVELAVTYRVATEGADLVVSAVTAQPGATITAADLSEAVAAIPSGTGPDIIHVVPDLTLSTVYRPVLGKLRDAGLPKAGRNAWYLDTDSRQYKRLTAAVRTELAGGRS